MKKIASLTSALLIVILFTACSSAAAEPTATAVDINALQTAAVETVVASITQTALAQPTQNPTETLTPAPTETATPAATATATVTTCDDSAFINDASVPDGTTMTAGQDFIKSWKVKNTGTCTWTLTYQIRWSHGEKMSGQSTFLTTEVAPGAEAEISINLKAPTKSGTYNGYWRLFNNSGYAFGERFSVVIVVP